MNYVQEIKAVVFDFDGTLIDFNYQTTDYTRIALKKLKENGYKVTAEQIDNAITTTIVNVFGVVCDGARLACAMKLASAAGIAMECAEIAMDGYKTPANEGVVGENADDSLNFMGSFAQNGMKGSDLALCKALFDKRQEQISKGKLFQIYHLERRNKLVNGLFVNY